MMERTKLLSLFFLLYSFSAHAFTVILDAKRTRRPSLLLSSSLSGGGRPTTTRRSLSYADKLRDMLWNMTVYFESMVDNEKSKRFYAFSKPSSGERLHAHNPIRDLGATWDVTTALLFWKEQQQQVDEENQHQLLEQAICRTLQVYHVSYQTVWDAATGRQRQAGVAPDPTVLHEPCNVGHSAMILLATTGALRLSYLNTNDVGPAAVNYLVRGILSMQRNDGAIRITFGNNDDDDDDVYRGIEFYPGEAMVAVMDVLQFTPNLLEEETRSAILPFMARAFGFYSKYYHQGDCDVNYNIWQVQAFARLFYCYSLNSSKQTTTDEEISGVATYVMELCQSIIESRSWKELARGKSFYPNLETVEIACGLDAIAQGCTVALALGDSDKARLLWRHIDNAVDFLQWIQNQVPLDATVGSGGLGHGGFVCTEQRLDVTGHAMSALIKVFQINDKLLATNNRA